MVYLLVLELIFEKLIIMHVLQGGFKEVIFEVSGEDVYGTMKFEASWKIDGQAPIKEWCGKKHNE